MTRPADAMNDRNIARQHPEAEFPARCRGSIAIADWRHFDVSPRYAREIFELFFPLSAALKGRSRGGFRNGCPPRAAVAYGKSMD